MQQFVPAWKDITDDPEVLDWVEHCHLEFIDGVPPVQETDYKVIQFNDAEAAIIESEIVQLLNKGVIVESPHSQGEFVSSIFVRLKKNGVDYRMILNLKDLNKLLRGSESRLFVTHQNRPHKKASRDKRRCLDLANEDQGWHQY